MIVIWIAVALCVVVLAATWVGAIIDMSRRKDMSGMQMAIWILVIVVFPIMGVIAYMLLRPSADKIRYRDETIQ